MILESLEKALEFNATAVIDHIAPRALSIITTKDDDAHPIEQIVEAYEMAREPKSLTLLDMYVLRRVLGAGIEHRPGQGGRMVR